MEYNEKDIKDILSNYFWMIKEVHRINEELGSYDTDVTAQYGIESTLPKQKGLTSDAVANEVVRRSKKEQRRIEFVDKIKYIQNRIHLIEDDREKVVLDCLLDGLSISAISNHMGLSRRHIDRLRNSIASRMSHMSHMSHN